MNNKITVLAILSILFLGIQNGIAQEAEWIKWVAPKSSNDMKNPFTGDAIATAKGKNMFKQMCALCHGMKGDGNGGGGVSLNPKPADFLALRVKDESDGAIFWKMTEGLPPMASYKDLLTEDQRWQLVNYIRALQKGN
jgi:mono/diheme cytochrome c family protein